MPDRQVCIDCGTLSPETETNYTLISSQFGWRLTRTRTKDGAFNVEWRCPACWKEHKRQKQAADEARGISSSIPPGMGIGGSSPPIASKPLPSFPSRRPPFGEDEPTQQRRVLPRPKTPVMFRRPTTPAPAAPPESPIPERLTPPRPPRPR